MTDRTPATSLDRFAADKLDTLAGKGLRRHLAVTGQSPKAAGAQITRNGRTLINFSGNDYLGLSTDPALIAAARDAAARYGAGAGASRLVTGNHPLYDDLERRLARLKGTEDAVVFGSGYMANIGAIPVLAGAEDLILIDALSHACIHAGTQLSKARTEIFPHNDMDALAQLLARHRGAHCHCLIVTDGVFSMDGDLAPLPAMADLAARHDAWLMTDDAHGLGVVGGGRGSRHAFDPPPDIPLQMGTLSKAVGAYGGYVCASRAVCELLRNRARSFVFTTGLPPGTVAAASTALAIIEEDSQRTSRPLALAGRFCAALGLPPPESPIVPLILGPAGAAMAASATLQEAGLLVTAIRPPSVPDGTARLRITFTATHADADVDALAAACADFTSFTPPHAR